MSVGRGSIPAMSPSAAQYAWFDRIRAMYCMTYVKGLTPSEFLARVGVTPYPDQDGLSSLYSTHWTDPLDIDNHWRFIGATQVQGDGGPWTLAIESNGWIGESDEYMSPASAGTQVLSHWPTPPTRADTSASFPRCTAMTARSPRRGRSRKCVRPEWKAA
ncbi:DUF6461 domain-containing protein [Streptomyces niveus]|uniref:DUF6461 domain-containing protein n=1 Tax=Streptomyces niveus TaxID=193462 RepID=UPI00341CB581